MGFTGQRMTTPRLVIFHIELAREVGKGGKRAAERERERERDRTRG